MPADSAAAHPPAPGREARACRLCGRPLSALARLRGEVCDAMDCRRRATDGVTKARRTAAIETLRDAAARQWRDPALVGAPILWLRHHAEEFGAPSPVDIDDLRSSLMALETEDPAPPPVEERAADPAPAAAALGGRLCALCRGRCCRFGLQGRAFLRGWQLRDWLAGHPGACWADAVEHYLAHVPAEHLESSCLFHARTGCALPRERRSQVCNEYACDTLEQLRDGVGARPRAAAVVGIVASHELHGAAVLTPQATRPLLAGPQAP
jgi:hypothetical protein